MYNTQGYIMKTLMAKTRKVMKYYRHFIHKFYWFHIRNCNKWALKYIKYSKIVKETAVIFINYILKHLKVKTQMKPSEIGIVLDNWATSRARIFFNLSRSRCINVLLTLIQSGVYIYQTLHLKVKERLD